jgi:hypothetical protein
MNFNIRAIDKYCSPEQKKLLIAKYGDLSKSPLANLLESEIPRFMKKEFGREALQYRIETGGKV